MRISSRLLKKSLRDFFRVGLLGAALRKPLKSFAFIKARIWRPLSRPPGRVLIQHPASFPRSAAALLLALLFPALSAGGDVAVARVAGEAITRAQVEAAMAREPGLSRDQALRVLSERLLALQWAKKRNMAVSDQDVDQAQESIRARNKMTPQQFEAALLQQGYSASAYREEIRSSILVNRAAAAALEDRVAVSERELEERWRREYRPRPTVKLRHLFLSAPAEGAAAEREEKKKRAAELLQAIRSGELAFADAVRRDSEDPATREAGGDLGVFSAGELFPEMDQAVAALSEGQVGGPVEGPEGIHLVQLVSRAVIPPPALDSVREALTSVLRREKGETARRAWLDELEKDYLVEVFPDGGAVPPAKDGGALPPAK